MAAPKGMSLRLSGSRVCLIVPRTDSLLRKYFYELWGTISRAVQLSDSNRLHFNGTVRDRRDPLIINVLAANVFLHS